MPDSPRHGDPPATLGHYSPGRITASRESCEPGDLKSSIITRKNLRPIWFRIHTASQNINTPPSGKLADSIRKGNSIPVVPEFGMEERVGTDGQTLTLVDIAEFWLNRIRIGTELWETAFCKVGINSCGEIAIRLRLSGPRASDGKGRRIILVLYHPSI